MVELPPKRLQVLVEREVLLALVDHDPLLLDLLERLDASPVQRMKLSPTLDLLLRAVV